MDPSAPDRACSQTTRKRPIDDKFGAVGASTACEKVNTAGTDENLFRLVPLLGNCAQVLPLELVPVPRHGAPISAWAPTKGYVQTSGRARAWCPSTTSGVNARARAWCPGTSKE